MEESQKTAVAAEDQELDISYELYILTLTVISLVVMVLSYLYLALDEQVYRFLWVVDFAICILFLVDFFRQLKAAGDKAGYLRHGGVLDLLGSMPAIPALRLFRLFRVARIITRMKRLTRPEMREQVIAKRAEFTLLFAGLAAMVLISVIGIAVYLVERGNPESNISTPLDALWWGITTSSTVGYGDRFPVTSAGRVLAAVLMITGVALIGVVSSYLASSFISPTKGERKKDEDEEAGLRGELSAVREDVRRIRALLERSAATGIADPGVGG